MISFAIWLLFASPRWFPGGTLWCIIGGHMCGNIMREHGLGQALIGFVLVLVINVLGGTLRRLEHAR